MKTGLRLVLLVFYSFVIVGGALAQDEITPAQTAENLRAQLSEVQAKEADLQEQAKQLDEALKPENIERSLAGIGSTRPEELRELRRKELTNQKNSVLRQLEILATSRARLESAIVTADAQAYQQSANGTPLNKFGMSNYLTSPRLLAGGITGLLVIVGILALIITLRRISI